jgi:hypothetical protein
VAALLALAACGQDHARRVFPALVPPPERFEFGAAPVLNERRLVLPLANVGRAQLTVESVRVREEGTAFRVGALPLEVESGGEAAVDLFFKPGAEREYAATLVVETDDPDRPVLELPLRGEGRTRAVLELEPRDLCAPPDGFGRTAEGGATVRTLTLRSLGTADLVVEGVGFTPDTSPAFSFIGSTRTPATVPTRGAGGRPGQLQLTVKYAVQAGAPDAPRGEVLLRTTDPDQPEVRVPLCGEVNRAPVALIAPTGNAAPGQTVRFDGSGSSDPDGNVPLAYAWRLVRQPAGARASEGVKDGPFFELGLDDAVPGEYEVELVVTDADRTQPARSAPARRVVVARPAQALLVELSWDNAETDLDLHLLRTPEAPPFTAGEDCYFATCRPAGPRLDWGVAGERDDDPLLLRDWLQGYGPEIAAVVEPAPGTYRAAVLFQNVQRASEPTSTATLRVYVRGVLAGEYRKTLAEADERWPVVDVAWPSGTLTPVPEKK